MTRFMIVALSVGLATLPMSATAADLDVDSVLAAPNAPDIVDNLPLKQRASLIRLLAHQMTARPDAQDIPKLLCAIRPWTTGELTTDRAVQRSAWEEMATLDPQSSRYRWLDCVAVNVEGGYRDSSLAPLYDLRQSYCTGVPIAKDVLGYLSELYDGIEEFNATVRRGMTEAAERAGSHPRHSYYPLRNEMRLSTVKAAWAVALAQAKDMPAARAQFASAADQLQTVLDEMDYANTRSGWVYHSDLKLHHALYDWLGRGSGPLDMSVLKDWPPALGDLAIASAIPRAMRQRMRENDATGYVDPVFVERLLPGAALVEAECGGWRRRSFDTHELAAQIETCANKLGHPPGNPIELRSFDACISEYQAHDWRVQFSSVHPDRVDEGIRNAHILAKDLMSSARFRSLPVEQQDRIAKNLSEVNDEDYSARYSRIVTNHDLWTEDRTALEQIFDDLKLSNRPLMAREPIY